jgi:hypothetical protein
MGINGQNTMSKLKEATNISDNRLSAHAPNGPGVTTGFRDFWIMHVGRDIDRPYYTNNTGSSSTTFGFDTRLSIPNATIDSQYPPLRTDLTGSLNSNYDYEVSGGRLQFDDRFIVRVDWGIFDDYDYAFEQIAQENISISTVRCSVEKINHGISSDGNPVTDIRCIVEESGFVSVTVNFDDGGFNNDCTHFSTDLLFGLTAESVVTDTVYIDRLTAYWDDTGSDTNSGFPACDGSTALDGLLGVGNAGDDNYGIRLNAIVNDPADQYGDLWLWVYFDDATKAPPDSPSGLNGPIQMSASGDKTGCDNFRRSLLPGSSYNIYAFITTDSSGSTIIDEEFISFTPQTGSAGSNTDTYDEQNSIT